MPTRTNPVRPLTFFSLALLGVCLAACGSRDSGAPVDEDSNSDDGGVVAEEDGASMIFDTAQDGVGEDGAGAEGTVWEDCEAPPHTPCDSDSDDPLHAFGLNCPDELQFDAAIDGLEGSHGVSQGLGGSGAWDPVEGKRFLVLGTGLVGELDDETPADDSVAEPTYCNDELDPGIDESPYAWLTTLREPIKINDVGTEDCFANPDLVGTGDCSNTIQTQFEQGGEAFDYNELRIQAVVPGGASSIDYNFAFFSTEYPEYYGKAYNDMYIAWLESERWTGNISFDEEGNPISLNAGFLDFKDDNGDLPEFDGTCMKKHAATKWLTTTAPVTSGETITVVFAIFDLADGQLDSYVALDNFHWGCDGEIPPMTIPIG